MVSQPCLYEESCLYAILFPVIVNTTDTPIGLVGSDEVASSSR